jgi:A/G-specific adenine glycosylase
LAGGGAPAPSAARRDHKDARTRSGAALLRLVRRHARDLPWRVGPAARAAGIAPDPYRVWLSEVMLQQTTVAAVTRYYVRFTALWPRLADLAAAPEAAVMAEWAGLGYYSRARNLIACARAVMARAWRCLSRHGGGIAAPAGDRPLYRGGDRGDCL